MAFVEALDERGVALGLWASDPELVEVAAHVGFDWFLVDQMFSANDWNRTEQLLRAGAATGLTPIVRIQSNPWLGYDHRLAVDVSRALGVGAPFVFISYSGSEELFECVRSADDWHRKPLTVHPWESPDEEAEPGGGEGLHPVIPLVESEGAFESLPAVLEHPEIDILFFGMTDAARLLAADGKPDWQAPALWEQLDRAVELGAKHGVAIGANTGFVPTLGEMAERVRLLHRHGVRMIMTQGAPFLFQIAAEELMLQLAPTLGGGRT